MHRDVFTALIAAVVIACGCSDMVSPQGVLRQSEDAYKSLDTYQAEGTVTTTMGMGDGEFTLESKFSMLLQKPNRYKIEWEGGFPGQSGALWNDGTKPYLYVSAMNAYAVMESDMMAFASATGISGGVVSAVPPMMFPNLPTIEMSLASLKETTLLDEEDIAGEACYVIRGRSHKSSEVTVWIAKSDYLVRKYEQSRGASKGPRTVPEADDEVLDEVLESMGQEPTEEAKANMRGFMEMGANFVQNVDMSTDTVTTFMNISSPDVDASDFAFEFPEGTVMKRSLFGGFLETFGPAVESN